MRKGEVTAATATALAAAVAALVVPAGMRFEAALIVGCLGLWLTELLPPFAPTLVLLALAPLVLDGAPVSAAQRLVFGWAADPVLALFFGGFVMSAAARRHGLDEAIAHWMVRRSGGDTRRLTLFVMLGTAAMTMWMSNVAAPAMMLSATRPILSRLGSDGSTRRRILVAIAMAANIAGMSTPLSAGPNGIAIAAVEAKLRVTFAGWMTFALPLVFGLLAATYWLVRPPSGRVDLPATPPPPASPTAKGLVAILSLTIMLWLSEPLHGVPASVVSLTLAATLFASRVLHPSDLARLEWSTLLLISGGVLLGHLTEQTGLLRLLTGSVEIAALSPLQSRLALCTLAALLAAVMSNTGTSALLIPIALEVDPSPVTAILVAIATSLGAPFVISTPANAMVAGEGVRARDFIGPGALLLIVGVALVATTGPFVLSLWGAH